MPPARRQVLVLLQQQGSRGLSAMDAMRALGMAGGSFTKRISELQSVDRVQFVKSIHKDPITLRAYTRYTLAAFLPRKVA